VNPIRVLVFVVLAAIGGPASADQAASDLDAIQACFEGLYDAEREAPYDRVGLFAMHCLELHRQPACNDALSTAMAIRATDRERALHVADTCRREYCPALGGEHPLCEADLLELPQDRFIMQWVRFESAVLRAEHDHPLAGELADRLYDLDSAYPMRKARFFGSRPWYGETWDEATRECLMTEGDLTQLAIDDPAAFMGYVAMRCEGLLPVPVRGATVRSPAVADQGDVHARYLAGALRQAACPGWVEDRPDLCQADLNELRSAELWQPWLDMLAGHLRRTEPDRVGDVAAMLLRLQPAPLRPATASPGALIGTIDPGPSPTDLPPIQLTILGINDFHGAVLDRPVGAPMNTPLQGGAAMLSTYIAAVRAQNPGGVLVVDAGDMLQGPLLCNHFEGLPVADVYNHLGVAAAAVGNHEFDYGPLGEATLPGPDDAPFGALEAFTARADFPLLSANMVPAEWPLPRGVQPHLLVEVAGVQVGLVGLSTPTTPTQTRVERVAGIRFDPLGPALASSVTTLRAQGAEVIVVLGHLDGGCLTDERGVSPMQCQPDGELVEVLAAAAGEVDAMVLGHRHHWLANEVEGVAVVEAGSRGQALSVVELFVDPVTRRVDRSRTVVPPPLPVSEAVAAPGDDVPGAPWTRAMFAGEEVFPDPQVDALLAPYLAEVEALCAEPLATAAVPIGRARGESAAGNLVADAMRASRGGVDVAIINSGSLRQDMAAGEIGLCDVLAMFPFDPAMVELQVTAAELESILEFLTSGAHSPPQVSGLRLVLDAGPGEARDLDGDGDSQTWERDRLLTVLDGQGRPLAADRTYRLLLTDYIVARPGDAQFVFGRIPPERITPLDDRVRDALLTTLQAHPRPLGQDGGWPLPDPFHPRISEKGRS